MNKKVLTSALAVTLVGSLAIGGSLAWLSDSTDTVKNVFTMGNVDIDLTETIFNQDEAQTGVTGDALKVAPGDTVHKNPTITVADSSEDCYVFVKVTDTLTNAYDYGMASGWTELEEGVWYQEAEGGDILSIIAGDEVTISPDMKAQQADVELSFKGYAIQKDNITSAADAWSELNK